jgi:hypothetical protein
MAGTAIQLYEIGTGGATITFDVDTLFGGVAIYPETDPLTLAANLVVNFTNTPSDGRNVFVKWNGGFDLDGNDFTINGVTVTALMASLDGMITFTYANGAWTSTYVVDLATAEALTGGVIKDGTLALAKLVALTSGQIIVGNSSNVPTAVAVSGDVTISNAGVVSIANDKITNAMVKSNAAIARSKMASGTAGHVVINDGSGVFTSEAQLAPERGGLGIDASAATGFVKYNAGTASIGAITETLIAPVSFEAGEVGTIFVDFPYACTILSYQFVCTKALAGTDAGTIQFADNAGTNMTGGLASIPASTAFGTRVGATITAGGEVAINDDIRITTAKTTAGGRGFVSITYTRLA